MGGTNVTSARQQHTGFNSVLYFLNCCPASSGRMSVIEILFHCICGAVCTGITLSAGLWWLLCSDIGWLCLYQHSMLSWRRSCISTSADVAGHVCETCGLLGMRKPTCLCSVGAWRFGLGTDGSEVGVGAVQCRFLSKVHGIWCCRYRVKLANAQAWSNSSWIPWELRVEHHSS